MNLCHFLPCTLNHREPQGNKEVTARRRARGLPRPRSGLEKRGVFRATRHFGEAVGLGAGRMAPKKMKNEKAREQKINLAAMCFCHQRLTNKNSEMCQNNKYFYLGFLIYS